MPNLTSVGITLGVPTSGTGTVSTIDAIVALIGTSADSAASNTDSTALTEIMISKQISKSAQAIASSLALETGGNLAKVATALGSTALDTGSGTAGTRTIRMIMDSSQLSGLGSTTMASAVGVTIATDQPAIAMKSGATASAVPAAAVYVGLNAASALPAAATVGQLTGGLSDKYGRQVVLPVTVRDLVGVQSASIATTSATTIIGAISSTFTDIMCLLISNNTAASNTLVNVSDGTVTFPILSVAGAPPAGIPFMGAPIPATTQNTAWTAACASTSDIRVTAIYAKNK